MLSIVLGAVYLIVGAAKLAGAEPLAEQFDEFGLGTTAMRAVGALEVAAAIGLQIDGLDVYAATGMVAMLAGALYQHRRVGHPPQSMAPAAALLVASAAFAIMAV